MKKEKIIYSLLMLVIIAFVFTLTFIYLLTHFKVKGNSEIKDEYYDIIFNNTTIDYETTTNIYTSSEKRTILFYVSDLNNYKKTNSINIDVTNIGNIDAVISNIEFTNLVSNINKTNVNIEISLNKDTIIKGGETKKLNIKITYNGKDKIEDAYYNFGIKFTFNEVVL